MTNMVKHVLSGILIWMVNMTVLFAQNDLSVSSIPDSLKKSANSVLRFDEESVDILSLKAGLRKDCYAVTVLNEKGEDDADFRFHGDAFHVLKSFSGKLFDAQGRLLKKFGKSDLQTTEYSSDLATDSKIYYFNCKAPTLPFTIQYEYEVSMNNGILGFGFFIPLGTYYQSVQHYHYQLRLPENLKPRIKSFNNMPEPSVNTVKGLTVYSWKMGNLKAVESEPLDPPLKAFIPYVIIAPSDFIFDGVSGSMNTWSDMGKWSYDLTVGRDMIPETLKVKLLDLTKDAKSDREKVKILYDYLGETTRYVSIQLGIGGFQPMTAMEVYKTGFGDCKALTNYLKAMLSAIGIPSYYSTIRYDDDQKDLMSNFPNFQEMNHVILMVPNQNGKLWLECTNPRLPFGYVHKGIAGHEVLVCAAEGGAMERIPDYADSLNLEQFVAHVKLQADGGASVKTSKVGRVKLYESLQGFTLAKSSEQADKLIEGIHLPNVEMTSVQVSEIKTATPSIQVAYSWKTPMYGSKTGSRLFLPVTIFRTGYDQLRKANRIHDLQLNMGYRDADSTFIEIPESFEVEALPPTLSESCKYGRFSSQVTVSGNKLLIVQIADVHSGKYTSTDYPEFMAFLNKISAAYKSKIILRKKTV